MLKRKGHRFFNTPKKVAYWTLGLIISLVMSSLFINHYTPTTSDAVLKAYVVQISTVVSGNIESIHVRQNEYVNAGQLLFTIDKSRYQYAYDQAKINYQVQSNHFDQISTLYKTNIVSKFSYLTVKNDLASAKNQLQQAKYNLDNVTVVAPDDGYITNLNVSKGDFASVGKPMMTFIDKRQWWVIANFTENTISRMRVGQQAYVSINSAPGLIIKANIKSIAWGVAANGGSDKGSLPQVRKTMNWIQLPQRFPVQIIIKLPKNIPLRVGTTAIVTVNTTQSGIIRAIAYVIQLLRTMLVYIY